MHINDKILIITNNQDMADTAKASFEKENEHLEGRLDYCVQISVGSICEQISNLLWEGYLRQYEHLVVIGDEKSFVDNISSYLGGIVKYHNQPHPSPKLHQILCDSDDLSQKIKDFNGYLSKNNNLLKE